MLRNMKQQASSILVRPGSTSQDAKTRQHTCALSTRENTDIHTHELLEEPPYHELATNHANGSGQRAGLCYDGVSRGADVVAT